MTRPAVRPLKKHTMLAFIGLLMLMAILFTANVRLFITSGPSMEPTYHNGDTIFAFRLYGELKKGDVVFLRYKDHYCAKRVAYLPGENVATDGYEGYWGSTIVPEGYVYVLGDNPARSLDSRDPEFGLVKISDIWGRPFRSPVPLNK